MAKSCIMNPMKYAEEIQRSWLFSEFSSQELSLLVDNAKIEKFSPGQVIIEQNKKNDSLFVVLEGSVSVQLGVDLKSIKKIAELREGEIFGEMSWLDGQNASSWVIAETKGSKLFRIGFTELDGILFNMPETHIQLLRKFAINLSHRLRIQ